MTYQTRHNSDGDEKRSAILDAAAVAFSQLGYNQTTIDYVGEALGLTKGSVYYYFKSKIDLFFAVHRKAMEINFLAVESARREGASGPLALLRSMAFAHAMKMMTTHAYQRVTIQGVEMHLTASLTEKQRNELNALIAMRDQYEDLYIAQVELAVATEELGAINTRVAVRMFLGALNWITMWYRPEKDRDRAHQEEIATQAASYVVAGLLAASPVDTGPDGGEPMRKDI